MGLTLDELINSLPPERRKAVEMKAAQLILAEAKKQTIIKKAIAKTKVSKRPS